MQRIQALDRLRENGRLAWATREQGWRAAPQEVVNALSEDGFEQCRHEEARIGRRRTSGGVWQGLNSRTGAVVSAIWVQPPSAEAALVFIDVDGEPVQDDVTGGTDA